eukprot:s3492_g4.t1
MGRLPAAFCCTLVVVLLSAIVLHFTVFCRGSECNIFHYWDILLSQRQLLIYHYRCRSFEDFLNLRMGKAYEERIAIKGMGFDRAANESKNDMLHRVFLRREAGTNYFDNTAHNFLPKLHEMQKMTARQQFQPKPHCISGYSRLGEVECRSFFLTAYVRVQEAENIYIDEWLNMHMAVGVDHVVIRSNFNSSDPLFSKYTEAGLVELKHPGSAECQPGCMASLTNTSTFWLLYCDVDEFLLPPPGYASLKEYLLPLTTLASRNVKQIRCMSKSFGSSGWKHRPAMPVVEAYVHRQPVLDVNGKSLALRDAINPVALAMLDPFPHRFTLTQDFVSDTAYWLLDLGYFVLWMDFDRHLVVSSPASRSLPLSEGSLLLLTQGSLLLLLSLVFCRARAAKLCRSAASAAMRAKRRQAGRCLCLENRLMGAKASTTKESTKLSMWRKGC